MATWLIHSDQHCDFTKLSVPWAERTRRWNLRWENQAPATASSKYCPRNNSYSSSSKRVSKTHPAHCLVGSSDSELDFISLACSFTFNYDDDPDPDPDDGDAGDADDDADSGDPAVHSDFAGLCCSCLLLGSSLICDCCSTFSSAGL